MLKALLKTVFATIPTTAFGPDEGGETGDFTLLWEAGSPLLWEAGNELNWKK